jgi:hypothetical protein
MQPIVFIFSSNNRYHSKAIFIIVAIYIAALSSLKVHDYNTLCFGFRKTRKPGAINCPFSFFEYDVGNVILNNSHPSSMASFITSSIFFLPPPKYALGRSPLPGFILAVSTLYSCETWLILNAPFVG